MDPIGPSRAPGVDPTPETPATPPTSDAPAPTAEDRPATLGSFAMSGLAQQARLLAGSDDAGQAVLDGLAADPGWQEMSDSTRDMVSRAILRADDPQATADAVRAMATEPSFALLDRNDRHADRETIGALVLFVESYPERAPELLASLPEVIDRIRPGRATSEIGDETSIGDALADVHATPVTPAELLRSRIEAGCPGLPEAGIRYAQGLIDDRSGVRQARHFENEQGRDYVVWTDGRGDIQVFPYLPDAPGAYDNDGELDFLSTVNIGALDYEVGQRYNQQAAYYIEELGYPPSEVAAMLQQHDDNIGQRMLWRFARVRGELYQLPDPGARLGPNAYARELPTSDRDAGQLRAERLFPIIPRGERADAPRVRGTNGEARRFEVP